MILVGIFYLCLFVKS